MQSSFAVVPVVFYLLFLTHCTALSESTITFHSKFVSGNASDNAESPRFLAIVASFTEGKAKIESIENAGTEITAARENLMVEASPKSRSSVLLETNLNNIHFHTDAIVDLVRINFAAGWHPCIEIEKVDCSNNNDEMQERMESAPDLWGKADLKDLCKWPYIAEVFSANWLLAQKYGKVRCKFPRFKFSREVTPENLKCFKPCMVQFNEANELILQVKRKVKEIRDEARRAFRRYLQRSPHLVEERNEMVEEEQKMVEKKKEEAKAIGEYKICKGLHMDGDEVRGFPVVPTNTSYKGSDDAAKRGQMERMNSWKSSIFRYVDKYGKFTKMKQPRTLTEKDEVIEFPLIFSSDRDPKTGGRRTVQRYLQKSPHLVEERNEMVEEEEKKKIEAHKIFKGLHMDGDQVRGFPVVPTKASYKGSDDTGRHGKMKRSYKEEGIFRYTDKYGKFRRMKKPRTVKVQDEVMELPLIFPSDNDSKTGRWNILEEWENVWTQSKNSLEAGGERRAAVDNSKQRLPAHCNQIFSCLRNQFLKKMSAIRNSGVYENC